MGEPTPSDGAPGTPSDGAPAVPPDRTPAHPAADVRAVAITAAAPETVLGDPPAERAEALQAAVGQPVATRRDAVAAVAARWPDHLEAWATLAELTTDEVDRYAYARVGYHRGLDALRAGGWRGSGAVRWRHPSNRGFLRSLDALRRAAGAIGELEEEERCARFLRQLDPDAAQWSGARSVTE